MLGDNGRQPRAMTDDNERTPAISFAQAPRRLRRRLRALASGLLWRLAPGYARRRAARADATARLGRVEAELQRVGERHGEQIERLEDLARSILPPGDRADRSRAQRRALCRRQPVRVASVAGRRGLRLSLGVVVARRWLWLRGLRGALSRARRPCGGIPAPIPDAGPRPRARARRGLRPRRVPRLAGRRGHLRPRRGQRCGHDRALPDARCRGDAGRRERESGEPGGWDRGHGLLRTAHRASALSRAPADARALTAQAAPRRPLHRGDAQPAPGVLVEDLLGRSHPPAPDLPGGRARAVRDRGLRVGLRLRPHVRQLRARPFRFSRLRGGGRDAGERGRGLMRVVTLATLATMPQARVLGRSLARHQPDWPLDILLVAGEEVVSVAESEEPLVRSAARELDIEVETLLASHVVEDLSILLVPRLLQCYAARASEPVLHLPCSAWVLGSLEPIESAIGNRSVLLVPRMTADVPTDGLEPSPMQMEQAGRIEETIMAVDGAGCEGFLVWWAAHVEDTLGSLDARRSGGRPEDRPWLGRFLELAPARFATAVLDDPGCNLNMWNLHTRTLQSGPDGLLVNGRWPVRFLNLPGFDPTRPYRLNARASRARVSRSPVLNELCERYAAELLQAGWRDVERREEVGRRLADGLVYDGSLRAAYAWALTLGQDFGDVFSEEGTREFLAWLEGPAPRGSAHGINRYVFHRVARERPDVMRTYPDLDGTDGAGYVACGR